jgi:hypothetical protein
MRNGPRHSFSRETVPDTVFRSKTWSAALLVRRLLGANWLLLAAATAQFPLYGAAFGLAIVAGWFWRTLALLAAAHAAAGLFACLI